MIPSLRIRLARRHAGLSQAALADAVGVRRSAVSHWEGSPGKSPSAAHLRELALVTGVQFEWLATGRGRMTLSAEAEAVPAINPDAVVVDDPLELRLLAAFRDSPQRSRVPMVEVVEHLAAGRVGRGRGNSRS